MSEGRIYSINGPVIEVEGLPGIAFGNMVSIGEEAMLGEVVAIKSDKAIVQVYEDTTGLRPGDIVVDQKMPLFVELGPGILGGIYDGLQRPLKAISEASGYFIKRGVAVDRIDRQRRWHFTPKLSVGDEVSLGAVWGAVQETERLEHRFFIPDDIRGRIIYIAAEGDYSVEETLIKVETAGGVKEYSMITRWPVRHKRPCRERLGTQQMLYTGQRVIDFLYPIARGGVAAIPGGFGTGKTITQHQLAKWSDVDVVVYIGCGERGNEITQVLKEFPHLTDPRTNGPLIERTVIIANTSNMPVAARDASIYTGITIAEYYRDMGYNVAVMADSTSRWAEALREIGGRLEMMPAEEGYPATLASRLAHLYERAGVVESLCGLQGSVSIIGAVSPAGGDFSEPVTTHTKRFVKVFWALDKRLAGQRHFPSINWTDSYSNYDDIAALWWSAEVSGEDAVGLRDFVKNILHESEKIERVAQLIGIDSLPDVQRLIIETARLIRLGFLQQNAYNPKDAFSSPKKTVHIAKILKLFFEKAKEYLDKGLHIFAILEMPIIYTLGRMKEDIGNDELQKFQEVEQNMLQQFAALQEKLFTRQG